MASSVGRPRTSCPEHDELIELGKELVAWAKENDPSLKNLHVKYWYGLEKGFTKKQWDHMCEKPEFRAYYEHAMQAISRKYIDGTVNPSIAQRFMRLYFSDLKSEENELLKYQSDLKKGENEAQAQNLANINKDIASGKLSQE